MSLALTAGQYRLLYALTDTDVSAARACALLGVDPERLDDELARLRALGMEFTHTSGWTGARVAVRGSEAGGRAELSAAEILDARDFGGPARLRQDDKRLLDAVRTAGGSLGVGDAAGVIRGDGAAVRAAVQRLLAQGYGIVMEPGAYADRVELYCDQLNGVPQAPLPRVAAPRTPAPSVGGALLALPIASAMAIALILAIAGPGS